MAQDYEPRKNDRDRNKKRWDGRDRKDQGRSGGQKGRSQDRRDRWDNKGDRRDRRDGQRDRRDRWDNKGDRRDRRDGQRDRRDDRRGDRREQAQEPRFPGQRSSGRSDRDSFSRQRRDSKPHTKEYRSADPDEPVIPAGVSAEDLDRQAFHALSTLGGANQEIVARHLVAAGQLIDFDAEKAYSHAQAAVKRAGRVDVVREAAALTAYATGRFEEALREVRAVRRMRGDDSLRAIEADSERGLGRPEKALEVLEDVDISSLPLAEQAEVVLVAAGARQDLEQQDAALVLVEDAQAALPEDVDEDVRTRLMSMQADLLRDLGREEEAAEVEALMPFEDEEMEILDIDELLDADVDHTNTPLRGTNKPLQSIYDGLVLDLDGVCYEGTNPVPYASEAINNAKKEGLKLAYATNNASRSAEEVVEKLRGFDIPAEPHAVMTSAMNLMYLLEEELELGDKVLVVGSDALKDQVRDTGFEVVEDATEPVAAVVQGFSPDIDWAQLSEAAYAINDGARFYATNLDATLPLERGRALGNGALVSAITRATGARPAATGKPKPEIMERTAQFVGSEKPLAVGDRLETDTAAAVGAHMPSLHVLTGISSAADVVKADRGMRPSYLALDLRGLSEEHPQPQHHKDGTWTAGVSQPVRFTRWGNAVIGGYEMRGDGDPITVNLDTYRALAAAGWEAIDEGRNLRLPKITVVENDDDSGYVQEANFVEEVEEPETPDEPAVAEGESEEGAEEVVESVVVGEGEEEPRPRVIDAEVIEDPRENPFGTDPKGTDVIEVVEEEPGELVLAEQAVETDGENPEGSEVEQDA